MTQHSNPESEAAASEGSATVKAAARDAVGAARSEVVARAEASKESVADDVSDVASALRTAAGELRSGSPQERTLGQIADGLADASSAIRGKDLGEAARDLSDFARRNPLIFLGGAALVGFAATRFAKASARTGAHPGDTGYGSAPMERPQSPALTAPSSHGAQPVRPTGAGPDHGPSGPGGAMR